MPRKGTKNLKKLKVESPIKPRKLIFSDDEVEDQNNSIEASEVEGVVEDYEELEKPRKKIQTKKKVNNKDDDDDDEEEDDEEVFRSPRKKSPKKKSSVKKATIKDEDLPDEVTPTLRTSKFRYSEHKGERGTTIICTYKDFKMNKGMSVAVLWRAKGSEKVSLLETFIDKFDFVKHYHLHKDD